MSKLCVDSVDELPWFAEVLERSLDVLASTPEHSWPSWFREYMH